MRILHLSTRLILGGSQENTVLSCEGQVRLGHEVHLAFGPIYGPEGSMLQRVQSFRSADGRGIGTHVVPDLVREISPRRDWLAYRQLRRLIETLKPDIVHTHSSKAGIVGRLAAWADAPRRASRPVALGAHDPSPPPLAFLGVVHTIHGPPFMPLEGGAAQRTKTRLKNWIYTLAERRAARSCHMIVSVADAMTRDFLARRIGRPEQYQTVYSGMEVERFLAPTDEHESRAAVRRSLGLTDGDTVIGTVARLAEHKGHDDLLESLAADLRDHPTWKLLWVGDGWWRARLVRRAGELGLRVSELDADGERTEERDEPDGAGQRGRSAQVILTGLVPPERVPGMLRAMDVLAHPSYREGLPRTVPQALLAGVCPVAYDVDGTSEACIDGQTGRLVPVGSRSGLRDSILWCANNPEERRRLVERGRAMCLDRFSAQHMVQELEKVYARAIERARR